MSNGVSEWLEQLGLGQYGQVFVKNDIDERILPDLTEADLKELGVTSLGHRKTLLKGIASLRAEESVEPLPAAGSKIAATAEPLGSADAERRQLTVMFCDLVGSTELSQRLDPEDLRDVMTAYQDVCKTAIERYDGYVARYMGDGVLAYFGYPQAHEEDAERAVRAGIGLVQAVAELTPRTGASDMPEPAVRVGIATGAVVVGDLIGEGASQESAVVGETPNLASRLQGFAGPNTVVVAPSTRRLAGEHFRYADLGEHELKGIAGPVRIWRVVGESEVESRFEALHGARLTPLIGREEEAELLLKRWRRARQGQGQVVLISGEAGIGKSRLTQVLSGLGSDDPHTRLRYQCSPHHGNSALYPFIVQLERAARFAVESEADERTTMLEQLLSRSSQDLERDFPLIAALLSVPVPQSYPALRLEPQRQKEETLAALLRQLEGLCRHGPVLQIFEDVHWIDPSSMELLELIIERVRELPVLLVITFRPEFQAPWVAHAHTTFLTLRRMSRSESETLVRETAKGKKLPGEILDQIVGETDGVPLFLEELTRTVLESPLLDETGDGYALSSPLPQLTIPESLHDSLSARLDRLGPVKEVVQLASTIGRTFSQRLLAAASSLSEADLDDALDRLREAELIFRRTSPTGTICEFKHALVRDAAYQSLLRNARQKHHRRIATALEAQFPEMVETEPETLAHHFTEAGLAEKAIGCWQRAGQRARVRSANAEAVAHFTRALELVSSLASNAERDRLELSLQMDLGGPLLMVKGHTSPDVENVYARARELVQGVGEQHEVVPVLFGLWRYHCAKPSFRETTELAAQLREYADRTSDPADFVISRYALGFDDLHMGQPARACVHLEDGWSRYDPKQRQSLVFRQGQDPGVACGAYGAVASWLAGYPDRSRIAVRRTMELLEQLDHPFSLAFALNETAKLREISADVAEVLDMAQTELSISTEQGFAVWGALAKVHRGWALAQFGTTVDGIASIEQGINETRRLGMRIQSSYRLSLLADAQERSGQLESTMRTLDDALALSAETGEHWWDAELHRRQGELLLRSAGAEREGEARFERALEIAREQEAKSLELRAATSLGRLWRDRGQAEQGRALIASVYDWFTEGFDTADLKKAKALLKQLS